MSMPYIDDELEDDEATTEKVEDFEIQGKAIVLDVDGGDIVTKDGDEAMISGEDALRQWIKKAFMTRAYVYPIYESDNDTEEDEEYDEPTPIYGSEVKDILLDPNRDRLEKTADIQQDIENVLSIHPDIISVSDFDFSYEGRTLIVRFLVTSIYGDTAEEVVINGTDTE